jgi:hypothetical protein
MGGHAAAASLWSQPEADCCPPLIGLDVLQRRAAQDALVVGRLDQSERQPLAAPSRPLALEPMAAHL